MVALEPSLLHITSQAKPPCHKRQAGAGWGQHSWKGSRGWSQTWICLQNQGQLLPQLLSLLNRTLASIRVLEWLFAAPWSLMPGEGGAITLAASPRQSPLIDLKPQIAFAKWDFKQ